MLTVQAEDGEGLQYFVCKACPYRWPITENKVSFVDFLPSDEDLLKLRVDSSM